MTHFPLILASQSPRRVELLSQIGIMPAKIIPADIDETPLAGEKPRQLVERLAQAKAAHISKDYPDHFILAADTVVAVGVRILGKPENAEQAEAFLRLMSGRRHRVIGGISLITPSGKQINRIAETTVKIKRFTDKEISDYITSAEWQGKAGGYGIQGPFAMYVKELMGSYTNIVGLCLYNTQQMFNGNGFYK